MREKFACDVNKRESWMFAEFSNMAMRKFIANNPRRNYNGSNGTVKTFKCFLT